LALLFGCRSQAYRPKADEEIFGAWENPEEYTLGPLGFDFKPDGLVELLIRFHRIDEELEGEYTIHEKWVDETDRPNYRLTWGIYFERDGMRFPDIECEDVFRVDSSRGTIERVTISALEPWKSMDPTVDDELAESKIVDPQHNSYRIYYKSK
jgi:hypothetical protein